MSTEVDIDTIELPKAGLRLDRRFVMENCYAGPDDIVIVAGTLIEDIGNACSDVDVYVIRQAYPRHSDIDPSRHHRVISVDRDIVRAGSGDCEIVLVHTVLPGTSVKLDVEFVTFAEVAATFRRVSEIFDYARRNLILLTKRIAAREEVMIHRMLNCVVLQGQPRFRLLLSQLSVHEFAYIAYRWVGSDFTVVLDLVGAWNAGELDRAVEFARENVFNQTSAWLRLRGFTNLKRKWMLTYLDALPDAAEIKSRFLDLVYLRGTADSRGKAAYIERALDYVDDICMGCGEYLADIPGVPHGAEGLRLLAEDRRLLGESGAYADWEYAYRAKAYGDAGSPTREHLSRGAVALP
jgi:hypothetical protein